MRVLLLIIVFFTGRHQYIFLQTIAACHTNRCAYRRKDGDNKLDNVFHGFFLSHVFWVDGFGKERKRVRPPLFSRFGDRGGRKGSGSRLLDNVLRNPGALGAIGENGDYLAGGSVLLLCREEKHPCAHNVLLDRELLKALGTLAAE